MRLCWWLQADNSHPQMKRQGFFTAYFDSGPEFETAIGILIPCREER
jgi:hypothetical protein